MKGAHSAPVRADGLQSPDEIRSAPAPLAKDVGEHERDVYEVRVPVGSVKQTQVQNVARHRLCEGLRALADEQAAVVPAPPPELLIPPFTSLCRPRRSCMNCIVVVVSNQSLKLSDGWAKV